MNNRNANFEKFDTSAVPSPSYVINLEKLEENCILLRSIADKTGVKILLALKTFSSPTTAHIIDQYLDGTAASGLYEAIFGRKYFKGHLHTFAPGLKMSQLEQTLENSDEIIFNSLSQYHRFAPHIPKDHPCQFGLRLNPHHSEANNPLYDPAGPWSRLGIDGRDLTPEQLEPFSGIHIHALCDNDCAAFLRYLDAIEKNFKHLFPAIKWINLGGGAMFTHPDFDVDSAVEALRSFKQRSGLEVYLEPGTAVALDAGAVVCEVLDVGTTGAPIIITDASATCHMPDVIEGPFTPPLLGAQILPRDLMPKDVNDQTTARVGGPTCLAGDTIGTYRFENLPQIGDRLIFLDFAIYTFVKNSTFNGTPLPAISFWDPRTNEITIAKEFSYDDFEMRLA